MNETTTALIAAIRAIDDADGQISYGKLEALEDALKLAATAETVEVSA